MDPNKWYQMDCAHLAITHVNPGECMMRCDDCDRFVRFRAREMCYHLGGGWLVRRLYAHLARQW